MIPNQQASFMAQLWIMMPEINLGKLLDNLTLGCYKGKLTDTVINVFQANFPAMRTNAVVSTT